MVACKLSRTFSDVKFGKMGSKEELAEVRKWLLQNKGSG
jgi:hypothetical protein